MNGIEQAKLLALCIEEAGNYADGVAAFSLAIIDEKPAINGYEERIDKLEKALAKTAKMPSVFLSYDIFNRKAQGILNRALEANRKLTASARADLVKTLKAKNPSELFNGIRVFLNRYRFQLTDLLTTTQVAALLEGAREVARDVPTVPMFPAALPPATLEPKEAVALIAELKELTPTQREEKIYQLPADQQRFARQGLIAEQQGPAEPPTFIAETETTGPEKIHFPIIDEASQELSKKNVMTRSEYDLLDSAARAKAFTVAGVEVEDTLTKIRDILGDNIREGADYQAFKEEILAAVDEGTFLSEAHMETVFRTNIQTAFSDGQQKVLSHPFVQSGFPYVAYDPIHDDRARHDHLELGHLGIQGTNIYRINDPVFQTFRPPWDYNCRCSWYAMTVRQAAQEGIEEAKRWLETGVEPTPPAFVAMPSFRPPVGFERSLNAAPLSIRLSCGSMFSQDAEGHEHKGKGPGGGQFTSKGKGGTKSDLKASQKDEQEAIDKYARFAKKARESGDEEAALEWERIGKQEQEHLGTFKAEEKKHGSRANAANAKYKELIAAAKSARKDAFDEVKADAEREKEEADKIPDAMWKDIGNVAASSESYNRIEENISNLLYNEYSTKDHFDILKEIESDAKEMLSEEDYLAADDTDELSEEAIKENGERLNAIAKAARKARQHLKAYVQHRKEMQAIKSGEDIELSMIGSEEEWGPIFIEDALLSIDASGHEHKGKGEGGGQFTGGGESGIEGHSKHKSGLDKLKDIGKGALDLEHDVKEKVKKQFERLPARMRAPISGFLKVFYGTYVVAQKTVDEVAKEQGLDEKSRERLATIVCAVDAIGMKANMVGGGALAGPLGSTIGSFIPVGSLSYLAFSTAKNPMAVLRGAKRAVADYLSSLKQDADVLSGRVKNLEEKANDNVELAIALGKLTEKIDKDINLSVVLERLAEGIHDKPDSGIKDMMQAQMEAFERMTTMQAESSKAHADALKELAKELGKQREIVLPERKMVAWKMIVTATGEKMAIPCE